MREELEARDKFIDNLQSKLEKKETAIATLQTELKKLENNLGEAAKTEIFLTEELNRFKYGIKPGEEPCGEQLQLFSTPEELPPEEQAAVNSQPLTDNSEPEPDTTEALQTEAQPEFLNPGQLAEWINKTYKPEKQIKANNLRDWFKAKSTCVDEYRAKKQEEYGFKFSHCDKKGTLWFTVG